MPMALFLAQVSSVLSSNFLLYIKIIAQTGPFVARSPLVYSRGALLSSKNMMLELQFTVSEHCVRSIKNSKSDKQDCTDTTSF